MGALKILLIIGAVILAGMLFFSFVPGSGIQCNWVIGMFVLLAIGLIIYGLRRRKT